MFDSTQFSRRRLLKIGAVGAVGVGALSVPLGKAASGKQASRLNSQNFPKPYQATFQRPPVLQPTSSGVDGDGVPTNFYTVTESQSTAQIVPGLQHAGLGLQRIRARRRRSASSRAPASVLKVRNQLPASAPAVRPPVRHLDAPARVGLAAPVRRVRQRRHPVRVRQGLPLPELPAGPDALVPRPRRALHRAERVRRAGRAVPPARPGGAGAAAAGRVRRADHDHRHDVRRERHAVATTTAPSPGSGATSSWSTGGRGR